METTISQIEFFDGWARFLIILPFLLFGMRFLYFVAGMLVNFFKYGTKASNPLSSQNEKSELPFVSIIVPARDEEANILECIISIAECDYPKELRELIVVDDASSDSTSSILEAIKSDEKITSQFTSFRVMRINSDEDKELEGKPGALQKGLDIASGELILMTDSDCTVSRGWISSKVNIYMREKSLPKKQDFSFLIASYTLIHHRGLFSKFQGVEWLYTHSMAAASNSLGVPLGCYGNNLSADKNMMKLSDGFRGIPFSVTEDLALMTYANQYGANISYPCLKSSSVRTYPCSTLGEYLSQHQRWVKGGQSLGWKAVLFVITTLSLIIGAIVAAVNGFWALSAAFIAYRIALDTIIIWLAAIRLREFDLILWTPPSILLLIIMESALPFLLLKKKTVWKGRTYQ